MTPQVKKLLLAAALAGLGYYGYLCVCPDCPHAQPDLAKPAPVDPKPTPKPRPKPKPRPGPWGPKPCPPSGQEAAREAATSGRPQEGGRVSPDGREEIQIDLPASERKPNIASKGLGCCVFRATEYGGRWGHQRELYDLPERMKAAGIAGGGWPEKLDKVLAQFAPHVQYGQSTGKDHALLKAVLASGRMAMVDYNGHDCHYQGQIAHMVCVAHYTDKWVCVSDNNFVREDQFVWMSPDEFDRRWGGWVVWLMAPPPPPVPHPLAGLGACCDAAGCHCSRCQCRGGSRCSAGCDCGHREAIGGPVYEWRPVMGDSTQIALFLAGRQVGNYSYLWKVYRPLSPDGTWGDPTEAPTIPPGVQPPTGVDYSRVPRTPHYSLQGHEVSRDHVLRAVEAGKVPDDEALPYLTLIGTAAQTDPVLADLAREPLLALAARFKVNVYDPSEWQVQPGFAHAGGVTIYLESPAGGVLSRTDGYPGPAALARALNGALRQADPQYDPKKDPDLTKPAILPFDPARVPAPVWAGGLGLAAAYLLLRKGK